MEDSNQSNKSMEDTDQGNKPTANSDQNNQSAENPNQADQPGAMPPMEGNKARPKLPENPQDREGLQLSGAGDDRGGTQKTANESREGAGTKQNNQDTPPPEL